MEHTIVIGQGPVKGSCLWIGHAAFETTFIHCPRAVAGKSIYIILLTFGDQGIVADINGTIMIDVDAGGIISPGGLCDEGSPIATGRGGGIFFAGGPYKEQQGTEAKGYERGLFHGVVF